MRKRISLCTTSDGMDRSYQEFEGLDSTRGPINQLLIKHTHSITIYLFLLNVTEMLSVFVRVPLKLLLFTGNHMIRRVFCSLFSYFLLLWRVVRRFVDESVHREGGASASQIYRNRCDHSSLLIWWRAGDCPLANFSTGYVIPTTPL